MCVVTWAIKGYRSFIVSSTVRSFDGQFKASIIFGTEFFTACFVLVCLGLFREYAIAAWFHKYLGLNFLLPVLSSDVKASFVNMQ